MIHAKRKKVVFAVDGEDNTKNAFDYYAEHIYSPVDEVTLVNVCLPPRMDSRFLGTNMESPLNGLKQATQAQVDESKGILDYYMKKCEEYRMRCTKEMIDVQDKRVSDAITQFSNDHASLLVMGVTKHGIAERIFMGSTTHNTLHKSRIPVLLIPCSQQQKK